MQGLAEVKTDELREVADGLHHTTEVKRDQNELKLGQRVDALDEAVALAPEVPYFLVKTVQVIKGGVLRVALVLIAILQRQVLW